MTPAEKLHAPRKKLRERYANDWRRAIMKGRLWIKTESAEKVKLVPNAVQTELIDLIWEKWQNNEPVRIIVPKPRREGISTISEAIIYSITAFNSNYNSYLLGYNDENAREIFEMTKRFHDGMELALRPETKASNAKELVFSGTDSKIVIGSAQNKEIRGKGVHAFHGSEVAFYPNAKETMGGLLQSIPDLPRTVIILESTGNGVGNWFERRCRMAERGEGGYTLFFIPWFRNTAHATPIPENYQLILSESGRYGNEVKLVKDHPQITREQLFWRRNTIDDKCDGDLQFFMQEYPATLDECFQASGTSVFDLATLAQIQAKSVIPSWQGAIEGLRVMISRTARGWLKVWEKPATEQWRNRYVIGADTGGVWDGADYSVAYVWDRMKRCTCATIHGHFDAYEYREYLVALSKWYQNAVIAVEINRDKSQTDDM
ncbi:MAG TPA: hypothetical protein PKI15_11120, partial [Candidatus Cloacimonadota bacterium]|nr:hypothetical protein [Candidatus Cloacimonadota bacterium]